MKSSCRLSRMSPHIPDPEARTWKELTAELKRAPDLEASHCEICKAILLRTPAADPSAQRAFAAGFVCTREAAEFECSANRRHAGNWRPVRAVSILIYRRTRHSN